MASVTRYAGAGANRSFSSSDGSWSDTGNITADDGNYASTPRSDQYTYTDYLAATDFGFSIPSGAQIDGIIAKIKLKTTGGSEDYSVKLIKADSSLGSEDKAAGVWPETWAEDSYGTSTDTWSESWTASDINNSNFGVGLSEENSLSFKYGYVDYIKITIYYTELNPPSAPTLNSATAGDQEVALSWSSTADTTGYKVKYGTSTGTYGTTTDVGDVTSYTVTGLTNGTEYFFVVVAYNDDGDSDDSNELSATPEAPPAPTTTKKKKTSFLDFSVKRKQKEEKKKPEPFVPPEVRALKGWETKIQKLEQRY